MQVINETFLVRSDLPAHNAPFNQVCAVLQHHVQAQVSSMSSAGPCADKLAG